MSHKINLLFFALGFVFFTTPLFAENIWTLGVEDGKDSEFQSFNVNDYPTLFPNDAMVNMNDAHPAKAFPNVLAGPMDRWGGSKEHTYTIEFDYPEADQLDNYASPQFEFVLKGIMHWGGLPLYKLNLNGAETEIDVKLEGMRNATLFPGTRDINTLKAYFPKDAIKKTGNKLSISCVRGAIFPLDCMILNLRKGDLDKINIEPVRGILKSENDGALRSIQLNYDNEMISAPLAISGKITRDGKTIVEFKQNLTPEENPDGSTLAIPFEKLEDALKEMNVEVTADYKGKTKNFVQSIPEERPWTIRVIHQTHLDIGYTHKQEDVLALQVQSLKDAVKYIKETKDYPEGAKFKFHPEGMWAVREFMNTATEQEKNDFIEAVRSRDLHLDVLYAQAMTGMYNDEELFELMQYAVNFSKKYNVVIDSAMQSDVPGYTWGLVPALAQNGIKYLNIAPNPNHRIGHVFHWGDKPFYWVSRSGKERVLTWIISTSYNTFHWKPLGHKFTNREIFSLIDKYEAKDYYDYNFIILRYCVEIDNGRPNRAVSDAVKEWNEKYHYPKLVITTNSETLREFEKEYGNNLPVLRGDYTPYWEDGAASTSKATGVNRLACEKILQAQTLWAMLNPKAYPRADFDSAWTDLIMYDEHTWGAHNSISEPDNDFAISQDAYKQKFAFRGAEKVAKLTDDALAAVRKNDSKTFDVINTSSWMRSSYVFVDAETAKDYTNVIASDGLPTPSQKLSDGRLVFYAQNIPAFASDRFTLKKGEIFLSQTPFVFDPEKGTLRNENISLQVDPKSGAIVSMSCEGTNFVNPGDDGNRGLNDYLYIIGRDAEKNRSRNEGNIKLTLEEEGPCLATLRIESDAPNCKTLVRRVTIYSSSNQIDIDNQLDKIMERKPEGTFFGFPFHVPGGTWRLNIPWAMIEVERDQLPGANRNFYTVQRFANYSNDKYGVDFVNLEATLTQFAPIRFTQPLTIDDWRTKIEPGGTIYSWICNNHWETNYKADQSGIMNFRYVIRPYSGKYDQSASERFAREVHQPLIAVPTSSQTAPVKNLFSLNNSAIVVSSMKPTQDGQGILVRLYNTSNTQQRARLTISLSNNSSSKKIFHSNPLEEQGEPLAGELTLVPYEIVTIRLE